NTSSAVVVPLPHTARHVRYPHLFPSFFMDTATPQIYTLSLHDALPISPAGSGPPPAPDSAPAPGRRSPRATLPCCPRCRGACHRDRKSTRLNSSHVSISYAVFCLKKKNNT